MSTKIKTVGIASASFTIGCGAAGETADYKVALDTNQTFDIGDRFRVPENWKCRGAWYHATDGLGYLERFRSIKVTPREDDVDLHLHGTKVDGKVGITVTAIYEAAG